MKCQAPFWKDGNAFGCGQCRRCRINRRRVTTCRIMLEGLEHKASSFVTLTVSPENFPTDGSVSIPVAQRFLKRVREARKRSGVEPTQFRYALVGEYGDVTGRPHYHAILFGVDPLEHLSRKCSCSVCSSWTLGHVHVGQLTAMSAAYVATYVVKGFTRREIPVLAQWKPQVSQGNTTVRREFFISSRRPGLGAAVAPRIAEKLKTIMETGKLPVVPRSLRIGGQLWPVGRYLVSRTLSLVPPLLKELDAASVSTRLVMDQLARQASVQVFGLGSVITEEKNLRLQSAHSSRTTVSQMKLRRSL